MFITAFKRAQHLSLSWARSIQSIPPSNFLKIHFNIILLSMPESSKSLYAPLLPPYVPHAPPILYFMIWSPQCYLVRRRDHTVPRYAVCSTLLLRDAVKSGTNLQTFRRNIRHSCSGQKLKT